MILNLVHKKHVMFTRQFGSPRNWLIKSIHLSLLPTEFR
jgi:hypothetical protein